MTTDITVGLQQKQAQRLIITPQKRMALHMLELPLLELNAFLRQNITENPFLEELDDNPADENAQRDEVDQEVDRLMKLSEESEIFPPEQQGHEPSNVRPEENVPAVSETLYDHLLLQLHIAARDADCRKAGEAVISFIDQDGYLRSPLAQIAADTGIAPARAEEALALVQSFSPAGVGARDLRECLMLQLKRQDRELGLAIELVEGHLRELEHKDLKTISRQVKAPLEDIRRALEQITSLEPYPGRAFAHEAVSPLIPDVIMKEDGDGGFRVELNNDASPAMRINPYYRRLLKDPSTQAQTRRYLREKFTQALWVFKALGRRQETLLRVAEELVAQQGDFLRRGPAAMKPLTLQAVAQPLSLSISTVSRAVADKHADTPYGIVPMKSFFSAGLSDGRGAMVSAETVKFRIGEIIDAENGRPLSDEELCRQLNSQGFPVARRTVAKYRRQLKIGSSHRRVHEAPAFALAGEAA